jgi:hypothetical protein
MTPRAVHRWPLERSGRTRMGRCYRRAMGRTTRAIGCVLVFLAGCGGNVTAGPQRATTDGGADDARAQGTGDGASGESGASVFPGCRRAASLDDAGPGVVACSVGSMLVQCLDDGGGGCQCVSEDPRGCELDTPNACGSANGLACKNLCGTGEYAVSCGGVPLAQLPSADGSFVEPPPNVFQHAPPGCRQAGRFLTEIETLCCPCE